MLAIDLLRIDGETQPRVQMNWVTVGEYAEVLTAGMALPPVTVFYDGADYWLADGFHRREAAIKAGLTEIAIDRRVGTREDAQWFSYGANSTHGLPRTAKDRARAVEAALRHQNGATKSDREIGVHCGVHHSTVGKVRNDLELSGEISQITQRTVTRNGTTYPQDTTNIGTRPEPTPEATTPTFDTIDFGDDDEPDIEPIPQASPIFTPPPPLPRTRYDCLVIDPPWEITKIRRDVRPNQVEMDYPTMNIDQLACLPVDELGAENCHLYLWTTHKHLPEALALVTSWDFRYQCLLTWVKNVGFTPFSWMYSTEHVLFCRRGNVPLIEMGRRLDFQGKVREHSRKPESFYQLVRDVSPGRRLELFARERRPGFDAWGNEVDRFSLEGVDSDAVPA